MAAQYTQFSVVESCLFIVWLVAVFWPIFYSYRHKTSFALSHSWTTVGLFSPSHWSLFYNFDLVSLWLWEDLWMRPTEAKEPRVG